MEAATVTNTVRSLLEEIEQVVGGSNNLPMDLEDKLRGEGLSKESFMLLNEADLKELGFGMGPRKLLMKWIGNQLLLDTSATEALSVCTPTASSTPTSSAGSSQLTSSSSVNRKVFKGCPAADVLSQYRKGAIDGSELAKRLASGGTYSRQERMLVVKIMGRHLMNNSKIQDRPHKEEKIAMTKSIIAAFPVFHDEVFYDPVSHTGHLEAYIRCRRSRNPLIRTLWTSSHNARGSHDVSMAIPADEESERILRECRPNPSNKSQLLQGMQTTREARRAWIKDKHPTITDIWHRYPRLQDMEDAVREEFIAITSVEKSLTIEFQQLKGKILTLAASSTSTRDLLNNITNDYDEDKRSEVAFYCLVVMLRPPPKRGMKKPLPSPSDLHRALYRSFENETVDGALARMSNEGIHQPTLFRVDTSYYVKLDNTSVAIESASCFAEALEFVFMCFWVFNVAYPEDLKLFYAFIEKLLGMVHNASKMKSRVLADVWRSLHTAVISTEH